MTESMVVISFLVEPCAMIFMKVKYFCKMNHLGHFPDP